MYTTKKQSASSELRRDKAIARVDCDLMMKCTLANGTDYAIKKRASSFMRFLRKNPNFTSDASLKMYRDHPELREVRRIAMYKFRDELTLWGTDPEMAKILSHKIRCCRNGKEVVRYVECQREKSFGVQTMDNLNV